MLEENYSETQNRYLIHELQLDDTDAQEAEINLLGFVSVLQEIDERITQNK